MIDPASQAQLKEAIAGCIQHRPRGSGCAAGRDPPPEERHTPHSAARYDIEISLVGTDGGNNQLQFDPFLIQLAYNVGLVMALTPSSSGIQACRDTLETDRAELGQKPAGIVRKTVEVTATVRGVDTENRTVTSQGPKRTVVLSVAEDIDLGSIKVGDQVDAMYRESLAIKVEPAPVSAK